MRNEVGVSVTTRHAEGAVKWRAADHPIRHAMRMAAWNAPGWPSEILRPARFLAELTIVWEGSEGSDAEIEPQEMSAVSPASVPPPEAGPGEPDAVAEAAVPDLPATEEDEVLGTREVIEDLGVWAESTSSTRRFVRTADAAQPLALYNRFEVLEEEEAEDCTSTPSADDYAQPTGRPPGSRGPRRGPRALREVTDLESHLMRPVPMRRRTESARVLGAHASFLQYWFRRTRALAAARRERVTSAPSAWGRGGMRGLLPLYRPTSRTRCTDGIARAEDFDAQRRRARRVLMWYRQYSELLRKLTGRQPEMVDLFCGEGGVSEGIRRAGLASTGVDLNDMPRFRARFGSERFVQADAYLPGVMHDAVRRLDAIGIGASPPCQPYSTVLADGDTATAAPGIPQVAASLRGLGIPFWVENVLGADANEIGEQMTVLRGPMFGLPVDRGRRFWTSFDFHLDHALAEGGMRLRQRCCLGPRRRWMRLDPFGRPVRQPCCRGNLYPVQGRAPTRSTAEENARAMGVDEGHMSWAGLSQSIPPDMAELVAGQLAMAVAAERYGAPRITFDDLEARPTWARRMMSRWLRGAGDDARDAGLEIVEAPAADAGVGEAAEAVASVATASDADPRWRAPPEAAESNERPSGRASWGDVRWGLPESDWRELYYSHVGGFTQSVLEPGAPWWLGAMSLRTPRAPDEVTSSTLIGENAFLHCSLEGLEACWPSVVSAMGSDARGTRVTIVLPRDDDGTWARRALDAGLDEMPLESVGIRGASEEVSVPWGSEGLERRTLEGGYRVFVGGLPRYASSKTTLVHDDAEIFMDPCDRGIGCEAPERKVERSYQPIPVDPKRWVGKGFSPFVEQLMSEGHRIGGEEPFGFYEIDQYKWRDADAQRIGGLEADRHVLLGALEYVSSAEAAELLSGNATVHPWTVVQQKDKWRACQDYSKGTNLEADTAPFRLPTVFDVRHVIKPGSHFAKWDLRDGFFHVPIHPSSRNRMLVRHPVSGLLMRCLRLPFGYVDSPRCFCAMTEAVAQKFRERVARAGISAHIFVYVDDALVVGDSEEDTRRASRIFEALLLELGLQWAPHKRRGPAQVIEFLGLLLCNHERAPRCITLTRKRQRDLRERLVAWRARRPARGARALEIVDPRELAVLLGNLVFASQVMPNARVYLQGMLASFVGLEVEWKRGKVRAEYGAWRAMTLGDAFWRDLDWWDQQLETNNCVPICPPPRARAAVQAGTDASDFGCGELIYLGGQREETRLKFTRAEKRRPINWRELLGILRVVEVWGERLGGSRLLVETDNTVAWATGSSGHSKAAEMQELLRRLCETCARYEIELSLTHQPGVKLDRPDQVSRGSAAEEPRARLRRDLFEAVSARFGPFTEYLGAEREFASAVARGATARCFVHSSHATVGSALRLVGERLRDAMVGSLTGVVVVPYAPEAMWWKLMKHFAVVAHLNRGGQPPHLEANTLSSWRPLAAKRESLIVTFPRSTGNATLPLHVDWVTRQPDEPGYYLCPALPPTAPSHLEEMEEWPGLRRQFIMHLPRGAFVYSLPAKEGDFGGLYQLTEDYRPTTEDEAAGPICHYLLRDGRRNADQVCPGRMAVLLEGKKAKTFQPTGDELYIVTHLVERAPKPDSSARSLSGVTDYFYFDAISAERQITSKKRRLEGVGSASTSSSAAPSMRGGPLSAAPIGETPPVLPWGVRPTREAVRASWDSKQTMLLLRCDEDEVIRGYAAYVRAEMEPEHQSWIERIEAKTGIESEKIEHWWVDEIRRDNPLPSFYHGYYRVFMEAGAEHKPDELSPRRLIELRDVLFCGSGEPHEIMARFKEIGAWGLFLDVSGDETLEAQERRRFASRFQEAWRTDGQRPWEEDDRPTIGSLPTRVAASGAVLTVGMSGREMEMAAAVPRQKAAVAPSSGSELTQGAADGVTLSMLESWAGLSVAGEAVASDAEIAVRVADREEGARRVAEAQFREAGARRVAEAQAQLTLVPAGTGPAPRCSFEGCVFNRKLNVDQSHYHPYCTGNIHPPWPRPTCGLPGCEMPCHPVPAYDAWYLYCGHSHGRLDMTRKLAAETQVGPRASTALVRKPSGMGTIQVAKSADIVCLGCKSSCRVGSNIEVFNEGFIHPSDTCRVAAQGRAAPAAPWVAREDVITRPSAMAHNLHKQARVAESLSDRRMDAVRRCVDGQCSRCSDASEDAIPCREGCGRTLHPVCADISQGYARKGAFTCYHCRLAAMRAEGDPLPALVREVCSQTMIELTIGREATSVAHSAFVTLSEKWVAEMKSHGLTRIASPTENAESFRQFARWMVTTAGRERSFRTTMRAAAGYFEAAKKPNFTKMPEIKKLFSELDDMVGTEAQPMTHGTRRMLLAALAYAARKTSQYIRVRDSILLITEAVGCLRATESCAAVQGHGLSANDCFVLRDKATGEVSVELRVHDSKTKFPRYVNMAAETTISKIPVAAAFLDFFQVNKLKLHVRTESGFEVISPDSYSVKLSLLGSYPRDGRGNLHERLKEVLKIHCRTYRLDPAMVPIVERLVQYATQASAAKTGGQAHKYVLLNEGPRDWPSHHKLMDLLQSAGFGKIGQDIQLVPAPLLRATHLGGSTLTPMPLTYDVAQSSMKLIFEHAYMVANPASDPDPEFDLQGHDKARWGQHSWRRMGEKTARDDEATWSALGLTSDDVDLYSGWEQRKLSQVMQIHYAGQDRTHRVRRRAITRST